MVYYIVPVTDVTPNAYLYLRDCLQSIIDGGHSPEGVLVLHDSTHESFYYKAKQEFPEFEHRNHECKRLNYTGNINRGLRSILAYRGIGVWLINQDCVLPSVKFFPVNPREDCGVLSPQQITLEGEPGLITSVMVDESNTTQEAQYQDHNKVTGFCMYRSGEMLHKIGLSDPYFPGSVEDDD